MTGERSALSERERLDWIRLSRTTQIGPITFRTLIARFGTAAAALDALPGLARHGGRQAPPKVPPPGAIEQEIEAAARLGLRLIGACEPDYPELLAAIEDAPPVITAGGNIERLTEPTVAIVGARNASLNGRRIAEMLARDLTEAGLVVVSGLARGIDTAAHKAAGDRTVAVLAGGADIVYPPENAALQAGIREGGCLVTEAPLGTEPMARHFPRRNRIISGLAPGVVIVEAARHSGSLITARLALEQGRDVFAVPGSPLDPRAQGTNNLIREGAILTETADDVLRGLAIFRNAPSARPTLSPMPEPADDDPSDLAQARALVLEALGPSPLKVDELARGCQVSLPIVLTILLELELAGRLERHPGQRVNLTS